MTGRSEGLPLELLWSAAEGPIPGADARGGPLPQELAKRFEGELIIDLQPDRPTIVGNFVSSLDGVVALGESEANSGGGGEISVIECIAADGVLAKLGRGLPNFFRASPARCCWSPRLPMPERRRFGSASTGAAPVA